MNTVAILRDPIYLKHSNGPMHPEGPERLLTIDRMLSEFSLKEYLTDIPPRDATFEEMAHTIHAHPTISESIMEAALDVNAQAIHMPKKRK